MEEEQAGQAVEKRRHVMILAPREMNKIQVPRVSCQSRARSARVWHLEFTFNSLERLVALVTGILLAWRCLPPPQQEDHCVSAVMAW